MRCLIVFAALAACAPPASAAPRHAATVRCAPPVVGEDTQIRQILKETSPATEPEPGITCPRGTSLVERVVGIGHSDIADVTQRFCQRPDGVRHGPFIARHGTAVIEQGSYQNGYRQGPWHFADSAGNRTRSGPYDGGHQHGRWVSHHREGSVAWRGRFACGRRTGEFIWWKPDGSELQRRTF